MNCYNYLSSGPPAVSIYPLNTNAREVAYNQGGCTIIIALTLHRGFITFGHADDIQFSIINYNFPHKAIILISRRRNLRTVLMFRELRGELKQGL
jgi:hypothetical protein